MKPLIQKLPLDEKTSFVAKTFRTPHFEVGWHQHIEYELILFTEGSGLGFVGNHVSEFETGDVYFLGSNLPHTFQKREAGMITSAIVVQFCEDFWGKDLILIPESRYIRELLQASMYGLKLSGASRQLLHPLISKLETAADFNRILLLGECLQVMASRKEYISLSTLEQKPLHDKGRECIDKIFRFTIQNFKDPVRLSQVAAIACMSVPAFCHYFKRSTKKTYIDFLNEVRTGYACSLLTETERPVPDIGYESGYNTLANFHKQFLKIKGMTPLQYRKHFSAEIMQRGNNIGIVG